MIYCILSLGRCECGSGRYNFNSTTITWTKKKTTKHFNEKIGRGRRRRAKMSQSAYKNLYIYTYMCAFNRPARGYKANTPRRWGRYYDGEVGEEKRRKIAANKRQRAKYARDKWTGKMLNEEWKENGKTSRRRTSNVANKSTLWPTVHFPSI